MKKMTAKFCVVESCPNRFGCTTAETKIFRFPECNYLAAQWCAAIGFTYTSEVHCENTAMGVCSKHFNSSEVGPNAIPQIDFEDTIDHINKDVIVTNGKPVLTCCIPHCKTLPTENTVIFNIPQTDRLREKWLVQMSFPKSWVPDVTDGVCERHFHDDDKTTDRVIKQRDGTVIKYKIASKRLNKDAYPTQLLKSTDEIIERDPLNFDMTVENFMDQHRTDINDTMTSESESEDLLISDEESIENENKNENENSKIDEKDKIKFKDNLHDFGNFIQTTLDGIYDEEIMLETQQKISAICFDAQSKWIEKNKSKFTEFCT